MKNRFGVTELYPRLPNGRVWENNWDNGIARTWGSKGTKYRNADPQDPMVDLHCKPEERGIKTTASVDGKGTLTLSGTTPRLYINDATHKLKWLNIEATTYYKVVKKLPAGGAYVACRLCGRSNHQNEYNCAASGTGYSFEAKNSNGYNQLKKELVHPAYADNIVSKVKGVTTGKWYGHKLIVLTQKDGSVLVQGYREDVSGTRGWKKIVEKVDKSDWAMSDNADEAAYNAAKSCTEFKKYPKPTSILSDPAVSCYLRVDNNICQFRYFSIIEIKP